VADEATKPPHRVIEINPGFEIAAIPSVGIVPATFFAEK
jgi:hypothetical protein